MQSTDCDELRIEDFALYEGHEYIGSTHHPPVSSSAPSSGARYNIRVSYPSIHAVSTPRRTTLLVILDGFGYRSASEDNAILAAKTPTLDRLWREAPHTLVSGSGLDVGLPDGQMGNSEVGHMSLGAGRIVYQSITRIDQAIAGGEFAANSAYLDAIDRAVAENKAVHVLSLIHI